MTTIAEPKRRGPAYVLGSLRGFGVTCGGPIVVGLGVIVSVAWIVIALVHGDRPPVLAMVVTAAFVGYLAMLPRLRRWGATPEEAARPLPGDSVVANPGLKITRARTIDSPVHRVWPWLAQIGQDRGGFYSYEWLENLAGCRMRNAERIHPEWQHREVGDTVKLHPLTGLKVARFEPERSLAFEGGWFFVLDPIDAERTRVFARTRAPRGLASLSYAAFIEFQHFVMERKMILGLKARAEGTND